MKTINCNRCGQPQNSETCCGTGKVRYLFNWIGGGWNETNADTKAEAYQKVLDYQDGKRLQPQKDSFRIFTMREYDQLIFATNMD